MKTPAIFPVLKPAQPALASSFVRQHRLIAGVLWVGVILVGAYHLGLEWVTVHLREPMGSWETVYAAIARAWPEQYQWSHYVDGHDGYGPGYPAFVRPFLGMGFDVYVAQRLANLVAIGLACALVAWLLLKNGCSGRIAAAGTTIFYALNAGSYSIQARPDFLVLLGIAMMLALGEAVVRGRIKLGAGFGAVFGLLALAAFFTKAYSVFTWGAVLSYLFVFVNWRRALLGGLIGGAILVAGISLFARHNPLYVMEVFRGQVVQAAPSLAWLRHQLADFALLAGGLLAAIVLPLGIDVWRRLRGAGLARVVPQIGAEAVRNYWRWQAGIAFVALVVGPGWHTGAYLTYFLHLLLVPVVVLAGLQAARARSAVQSGFDLALLANLAVLIFVAPGWPRPDASWAELRQDILNEPGRVAVDYLMEPIARERAGIRVVSTGQTGYTLKEPFLMPDSSPTVVRARAEAAEFIRVQSGELFGENPVDAIYLDCVVFSAPEGAKGRFSAIPRNEIPYFVGPAMNAYAPAKVYHIRPFYFATNAPRQEAGIAGTTIVKFVRKR